MGSRKLGKFQKQQGKESRNHAALSNLFQNSSLIPKRTEYLTPCLFNLRPRALDVNTLRRTVEVSTPPDGGLAWWSLGPITGAEVQACSFSSVMYSSLPRWRTLAPSSWDLPVPNEIPFSPCHVFWALDASIMLWRSRTTVEPPVPPSQAKTWIPACDFCNPPAMLWPRGGPGVFSRSRCWIPHYQQYHLNVLQIYFFWLKKSAHSLKK